MRRYAEDTTVEASDTRREIEALLSKHGADQFLSGWDTQNQQALVGFRIQNRQVRILLPVPKKASAQQERRLWRALLLVLKAKLVAVADGISTIEKEFLADIVLANGQTVGQWASPQIEGVYETGQMPSLLPGVTPLMIEGK